MVGFMHFPRSPRHLELDPIGELISLARGRVETCVVLVNPDNTLVAQVAALGPDWIQLHGPETPHRVEAIRDEAGIAIMKVCSIGNAEDVDGGGELCRVRRPHPARRQAAQGRDAAGRAGRDLRLGPAQGA